MTTEASPKPKAMTTARLAALYNISPQTLTRWLQPFAARIGDKINESRVYTPKQVAIIYECLGEP